LPNPRNIFVPIRPRPVMSRNIWISCGSALCLVAAIVFGAPVSARSQEVPPSLIEDLVTANHILAKQGIVDSFGHVSVRHPTIPDHFLMSQAKAPGRVTADDIVEFDLDGNPINGKGRQFYSERFIHSEIYRARKDVNAVIHSHSPTMIPFGVSNIPLRAVVNTAAFLAAGAPVFDLRKTHGMTNLLVTDPGRGKALAKVLGNSTVALMRGHGDVVVAANVRRAVIRAVYAELNAKLLWQALTMKSPIMYLSPEEGAIQEAYFDEAGPGHATDRFWENLKSDLPAGQ
jgi:ribulose-5-phosphate 4-epimerase/fuculose-1-phosphate aldolase